MDRPNDARDAGAANLAFARTLVRELHARGVATAVVCPGSRSAPLALAVAAEPGLAHSVHIDERNAAFHALGHAKATGQPVALVCTSGTAGANFLPAVAEACQARVPLIVLTADRPPELRAWGAAQTMEQRTLFAGFTRWSEESPCPSEDGPGEPYARALARRAVSEAMGPAPGPVHLNLPFREPLLPATIDLEPSVPYPPAQAVAVRTTPAFEQVASLAKEMQEVERGVLVFGPDSGDAAHADEVRALAERLGWPVLADPASGLRAGSALAESLVCAADLLLRSADAAAALAPELVVRFGGLPTSKAVSLWMAGHPAAEVWLVDPVSAFRDPQHRASRSVRASAGAFCAAMAASTAGPSRGALAWRARWQAADRRAHAALEEAMSADSRFFTPQLARALWGTLPEAATLYAANSMAIRELDAFVGPRRLRLQVLANRGVNGIDGQVSGGARRGGGARRADGAVVRGPRAAARRVGAARRPAARGRPHDRREQRRRRRHLRVPAGGGRRAASGVRGDVRRAARTRPRRAGDRPRLGVRARGVGGVVRDCAVARARGRPARDRGAGGSRGEHCLSQAGLRGRARRVQAGAGRVRPTPLHFVRRGRGAAGPALMLLHGYSGRGSDLDGLAAAFAAGFEVLSPDLPGHGASAARVLASGYDFDACLDDLVATLDSTGHRRAHWLGYSMGARLALGCAVRHPASVASLVLVGGRAGIEDDDERATRYRADAALAGRIEAGGLESFVDEWLAQPLFDTQRRLGEAFLGAQRRARLENDAHALATALRVLGPAAQPPLHDALPGLRAPVLLVAGALDHKFVQLAHSLARRLPNAEVCEIADAGHAVHLEQPAALRSAVSDFLRRACGLARPHLSPLVQEIEP